MKIPPLLPALLFISPLLAQTQWGHEFSDQSDPALPLDAGFLVPLKPEANTSIFAYSLTASSQKSQLGEDYQVLSLTRFDGSGNSLWSNRLDTGASHAGVDLLSVGDDGKFLFGEVNDIGNTTFRFGLVDGSDLTPAFVKEVNKSAQSPHAVNFFSPSLMGAMIDNGSTIEAFVLDETGATVFDKRYSAPIFTASGGLSVQSVLRSLLPDGQTIGTSVALTTTTVVGAGVVGSTTLTPFFTDLAGEVTSATSLNFVTSPAISGLPFPSTLADNSLLYRVPDIDLSNPLSPASITHLIKVKADGTVGWAKTVSSGRFLQVSPTDDRIYLAGSIPKPGGGNGSSQAAVIAIDLANGNLISQAVFDSIDDIDSASVLAAADQVYLTITSSTIANPTATRTTLVRTAGNLTNPVASSYSEEHLVAALFPDDEISTATRFLFTAASQTNHKVRAYSLDADLAPELDCEVFAPTTVNISTPLSLSDLPVTVSEVTVTAADNTTVLTDSILPLASYDLATQAACEAVVLTSGIDLVINESRDGGTLSFPTENGLTYSILHSPDLSTTFTEIGTIAGDGGRVDFPFTVSGLHGFYQITPPPPGQ